MAPPCWYFLQCPNKLPFRIKSVSFELRGLLQELVIQDLPWKNFLNGNQHYQKSIFVLHEGQTPIFGKFLKLVGQSLENTLLQLGN